MNIIIMGASGSGKGTQAKILAEEYNLCHISMGDLFREAIEQGTPTGKIAKDYVESGKWVPLEVTAKLIEEKIVTSTGLDGFILDGYPRNIEQAKLLKMNIDIVLNLNNDLEGLVKRLTDRRTCKSCGEIYSLDTLKGKEDCPKCAGELFQRSDDNEPTIRARFNSYLTQTVPVIDFYKKQDLLYDIDADQSIKKVTEQIKRAIKNGVSKKR